MDRPLVCGLLCLLLCLVASASGGPAPDSPLTTDRQGHGWETADVSTDALPEGQRRQKSSPWKPVITHTSLRIRRQSNNNKKKKKRPNAGSFSVLSVSVDGVKVPSVGTNI
ncbi:hypothetical protein AALO_G00002890 [Alosa alosa]|uniref:Uncharacterized protein n=1 Tax=Alosa alosa TaxID=278164 RepID=A0AAV6HDE7_9TELE|nr:hypothetical protein AALO_G00002890 [Alosa alosa]